MTPTGRTARAVLALATAAALAAGCTGTRTSTSSTSADDTGASAMPAATSVPSPSGADALAAPPSPAVSFAPPAGLLAPQAGAAYGLILGPSRIDDGAAAGPAQTGAAVAKTLNAVNDAFGSSGTPSGATDPASVVAAHDLDAKIPLSEYDLTELAKTLPSDPIQLYRTVTDSIAVDAYDGVMRGPLVTWMSRAGGPTDKVALLAWLFLAKGIPYQFVRGTLSADDRSRIAVAASAVPKSAGTSGNAQVDAYARARTKDGSAFAGWARGLLAGEKLDAGSGAPADRVAARHYWMQIERGGALFDLDPTLPGSAEGTHLGAPDASFKPWAALPPEEWHRMQVRVTATFADGSSKALLEHTDTVPELALTPIAIVFAPSGAHADPAKPETATALDTALLIGSSNVAHSHLDLSNASSGVRSVTLEVRRNGPSQTVTVVAKRALLDASTAPADRAARLAGLTTIVVSPGRGATDFATHERMRALAQFARDVADAKAGRTPQSHPWYPIRIADYYARDDAVADSLAAGGVRLYRDRPNVVMQRTWFVAGNGGGTNAVTAFDIADNGMGSTAARGDDVVNANLTRGYADTQIERDVSEGPAVPNTIELFAAAKSANTPVDVLAKPAASDASDPLRAGLDQTFAAGQVAIAPRVAVRTAGTTSFGWWAIDPSTGNSVGRMTGGIGQDLAEESVTINTISRAYTLYGQLQAGATCVHEGFRSVGCTVAVCASIASYIFGGGTFLKLASNYGAGEAATAGCSSGFSGGKK